MGCCLTSWFSKKQTALAISTTEAEYVSTGKACQQALWMKQALVDYDIKLNDIPVLCDNKGAIDLRVYLRESYSDCLPAPSKICSEDKTLGESRGESFWKEGDDFGVDVLRFHTCLTGILGFLEKLEWWFQQDIDDEGEEDEEGEGVVKYENYMI
ncbi:hypothetical protein Tco_0521035 [Tanacetum coccineum]